MKTNARIGRAPAILAAACLLVAGTVSAEEHAASGTRWEVWLAATHWPGFGDLEPQAGGSFDSTGFGIGGGAHWPITATERSEFLLGAELAVLAHDSSIPSDLDDVLGRDGYIALSAKWMLGVKRAVSLDAGFAYHFIDISQVENDYYYDYDEFESWEDSAAGPFVGFTWDTWAGREGKNAGLALGFKVHFVDFDTVRDEDVYLSPLLGPDAGTLDGPIYLFQVGYSSR